MKRLCTIIIVLGMILLWSCGIVEDKHKSPTTSEKTTVTSEATVVATEMTTATSNYDEIDNTMYSWWFKRNDEHKASGCQEGIDFQKYNAYYVGNTKEKTIYLTFDCGYDNGLTEKMLDTLKKHKAPAAFFVTQTYIRDNLDLVKRMKEEGHIVGNHTIYHVCMPEVGIDKSLEEVTGCAAYMKEATGYDMDMYFRPPKGEYSERTLQLTKDLGYKTIFWSMAYMDYDVNNQPSKEHVVEHFNKYYHNGAVPLLHNISTANEQALDDILTNLEKQGYKFEALDKLTE